MALVPRKNLTFCRCLQPIFIRVFILLNECCGRRGGADDLLELFQSRTGQLGKQIRHVDVVLERLWENDDRFVELKLDRDLIGIKLSDLIRALCSNTTVKHVFITDEFMETLSFEKSRIMFEIIGGLPKLETLSIRFPFSFLKLHRIPEVRGVARKNASSRSTQQGVSGEKATTTTAATTPVEISATTPVAISTTASTDKDKKAAASTASLLCSAISKAARLRYLAVHNLQLCDPEDDTLLAEAFSFNTRLKKVDLFDFIVAVDATTDSARDIADSGNLDLDVIMDTLADLPKLEEIQIRMTGKQPLPGTFLFASLAKGSTSLRSLVLWNIILSMSQLKHMCNALSDNVYMRRLELWCCAFGTPDTAPTDCGSGRGSGSGTDNGGIHDGATADDDCGDLKDVKDAVGHVNGNDAARSSPDGDGNEAGDSAGEKADYKDERKPLVDDEIFHDDMPYFNLSGLLLAHMLEKNNTLQTVVMSHVGLNRFGCIALARALKNNTTLQDLALIALSLADNDDVYGNTTITHTFGDATLTDHSENTVDTLTKTPRSDKALISRAIFQMMNNNKSLKSLCVTYDQLSLQECIALSESLQKTNMLRRVGYNLRKAKR